MLKLTLLRNEIANMQPLRGLQLGGPQDKKKQKKNEEPEAAGAVLEAAAGAAKGARAASTVLEEPKVVILDGVMVKAASAVRKEVEEEEVEEEAEAEEEQEQQDEKRQKVGMGGKAHVLVSNGFDSPQVVSSKSGSSVASSSGAGMFGYSSQDDTPIQAIPESEREEYVGIISRFATLLNDKTLQDVIDPCLLATILEEFEFWYPPMLRDDSRCVADFWRVQFMENKYNAVYSKIEELLKKLRPCQKEHIITCNNLRIISVGILGLLQNVSTPLPGPR